MMSFLSKVIKDGYANPVSTILWLMIRDPDILLVYVQGSEKLWEILKNIGIYLYEGRRKVERV